MSVGKYVDKIWQNMARQQLENELNFLTTDDDKKIKLPIDDNIDYLKIFNDTHKTPEEELQDIINKAIEYINDLDNYKNTYANGDRTITNDYIIKLLDILKGEDNDK